MTIEPGVIELAGMLAAEDGWILEPTSREQIITFVALANQWHDETDMHSSLSRITSHPAYLRIIGMGEPVLPLIIRDLQERGGSWYAALRAITGASPVSVDARGNVPRMKDAWIRWARDHAYRG